MFFYIRNRSVRIIILGFVILSIYMYYRTTVDSYNNFIEFVNTSNLPANHDSQFENVTVEFSLILLQKNTSSEQSITNSSIGHNLNNQSISTSASPQSILSINNSTNLQLNNSNLTIQDLPLKIVTNSSLAILVHNNSARAIYQAGHDVAVPEKCPTNGKDMNLVIVVTSAPSHIEARTAIRQTWGHFGQRTDVSIVFILGTTKDNKLEKLIKYEEKIYADIIRGRFIDSYNNLTLKTISTLEWKNKFCSDAKFLLKTDDDMFINVPRLLSFIKQHEKETNVIYGRLAKNWKPIRNKKSKYYVSLEQFKQKLFPDFTTGPAYLLSKDVIHKLYEAALDQTYLKLEDVFTTGIVAHKIGIRRIHVSEFLNKKISYNPCNVQRGISIHMVKYGEQFDLWKKLLDGKSKCKL
ncbi:beta-1,3-galactosyltransferase 5 [Microplitis demolitor]|uniref:beta-1,3-galactosyltransferase 5 n=1 Tax=Microplitis demolitor TaxID=69319 RepID=UPI0004CD500D|nr:beta-1,3-galactosyltransferase 5 [Microplitis demolitor]